MIPPPDEAERRQAGHRGPLPPGKHAPPFDRWRGYNRILASAAKFCLRSYLERWVSKAQQGFLNRRPANYNVLHA
eukprot:15467413-Alexandrium_andersonii.AAC.1